MAGGFTDCSQETGEKNLPCILKWPLPPSRGHLQCRTRGPRRCRGLGRRRKGGRGMGGRDGAQRKLAVTRLLLGSLHCLQDTCPSGCLAGCLGCAGGASGGWEGCRRTKKLARGQPEAAPSVVLPGPGLVRRAGPPPDFTWASPVSLSVVALLPNTNTLVLFCLCSKKMLLQRLCTN